MKCPLLVAEDPYNGRREDFTRTDCLKENCSWWSQELERCDPTGLAAYFIALGNTIGKIADRMPKDLAP